MSSEQGGCASSSAVARATGLRIGLKACEWYTSCRLVFEKLIMVGE
jgi:hypothetical protein